mmetsp:Transcript_14312/g.31660  ORF Transcript_14312/g.31660 Transcript_14312/m.31660 type:complete len:375 (+) Transcript_14312:240-1364(+)
MTRSAYTSDELELHLSSLRSLVQDLTGRVQRLEQHAPVPGSLEASHRLQLRLAASPSRAYKNIPEGSPRGLPAIFKHHEKTWPHSAELASQLTDLHRKTREELASQQALQAEATRFDLGIDMNKKLIEEGLEELAVKIDCKEEGLRQELHDLIGEVRQSIEFTQKDLVALRDDVQGIASKADAAVPQAVHDGHLKKMKSEIEGRLQVLDLFVTDLSNTKTDKEAFEAIKLTLGHSVSALETAHSETRDTLLATRASLEETQRQIPETYATLISMAHANTSIETLEQRATTLDGQVEALEANAVAQTSRSDDIDERLAKLSLQASNLSRTQNEHHEEFSTSTSMLAGRCDSLHRDLKALDRRERSSWEQFSLERR